MSVQSRKCERCGGAKPGRNKYCSDECSALAKADKRRERAAASQAACKRCGGVKEPGRRGSKYCDECRRVVADQSQAHEFERSRRRNLAARAEREANGQRIARKTLGVTEGHKWCARCQQEWPLSSFPPRATKSGGGVYCKPCQRSYNRERRLKLEFGLSWDDYDLLLICQDGRCAICGGKPRKYGLAVDHDHKTGEIRGLLCSRCNHRMLGAANDDPARLRKAADYLEEFGPREVFGQRRFIPGFGRDEREPLAQAADLMKSLDVETPQDGAS